MTVASSRPAHEATLDQLSEQFLLGRSETAGEPAWLRDTRLAAYKRFADQDWPDSRRDEYWRSTKFSRLDLDLPIVTDGRLVEARLDDAARERGVVVTDLATAAGEYPDLVRAHLGALTTIDREGTGADDDRTITASDAAWTEGVFVHVPAEVEVDEPIGIRLHLATSGAHLPRVLIVVDHHAAARVHLEHTSAVDEPALVDEVVEAIVGDGARLDLVTLNEWEGPVDHLSLQKARLHRDARYRHLTVQFGGRIVRVRPEVDLVGEGATCEPLGVYFADEGQHFDLQPYIRHIAPRATSDVLFKGALQGRSKTVFRGNVWVGEHAVGTITDETNRSLILTDGAKADSTPFLEIFCADIQAGHGSATGQLDEDHLFYLQSRGVPRAEAVRLIVYGFFREVLERVEIPGIRERALAHIEREIETADLDAFGVTHRDRVPGATDEAEVA